MRPMEQVEVLQAACCVAGTDGTISDQERELISKLGGDCGVGKASLQAMIERAKSDCSFCDEQFQILKTDPQETMAILLELAIVDGVIDDSEHAILQSFASRLNVPEQTFGELLGKVRSLPNADPESQAD